MGEKEEPPSSDPPTEERPPVAEPEEEDDDAEPKDVLPPALPLGEAFFPRMRLQSSSEEIEDDVPGRYLDSGEEEEDPPEDETTTHPEAQRAMRIAVIALIFPFLAPVAVWQTLRAVTTIGAEPRPVRGGVLATCAALVSAVWLAILLLGLLLALVHR